MSQIQIDIKRARAVNAMLPPNIAKVDGVKNGVNLLRWRVDEKIQSKKEIAERINNLYRELDWIEKELREIYMVTNDCLVQYMNVEEVISHNADEFE